MSVSIPRSKPLPPVDREGAIPPLQNGNHLTHDEFMRRYEAMPHLKKAELIEGVVYASSSVSQENHGKPHLNLAGLFFLYRVRTPGVEGGDNSTVFLSNHSCPQPDLVLFVNSAHGGLIKLDDKGYIVGTPDLVAEVAASTASYDLHEKFRSYEREGVREYITWRVLEREVDWFIRRDRGFEKLLPQSDGILRSTIFPGLWLDPSALVGENFARLLEVLHQGLDSPDHTEFVTHLHQASLTNKI